MRRAAAISSLALLACGKLFGSDDTTVDAAADGSFDAPAQVPLASCQVDGGPAISCSTTAPICMTVFHGDTPGDASFPPTVECIPAGTCGDCACVQKAPPSELLKYCGPLDYTFKCMTDKSGALYVSCQR